MNIFARFFAWLVSTWLLSLPPIYLKDGKPVRFTDLKSGDKVYQIGRGRGWIFIPLIQDLGKRA